jgi:aspartate-semialdehyde dehydrogenase
MVETMGIIVSVIGSTSLKGQALRESLPTSGLKIKGVRLLDEEELIGTLTEYDGGAEIITRVTSESLQGSDLIFLCGSSSHSSECLSLLKGSTASVIDLSGCTAASDEIPIATASLPRGRKLGRIVSLPETLTVGLASVLSACLDAGELELAAATAMVPVSDLGKEGNESLHAQVVELMNFGNIPDDIFGRQLIFNIHPIFGEKGSRGRSAYEERVETQIRTLLPFTDFSFVLNAARAPLFYGTSVSVFIKYTQSMKEESLRASFENDPLLELSKVGIEPSAVPSPIDCGDKRTFHISRIMSIKAEPSAFMLWFSFDNILRGAVLEALALAKEMIPD